LGPVEMPEDTGIFLVLTSHGVGFALEKKLRMEVLLVAGGGDNPCSKPAGGGGRGMFFDLNEEDR
jgi:hypothetical protein